MQTCPRCGTQTDPSSPYCRGCGLALSAQPAPINVQQQPAKAVANKTMLGLSPNAPVPSPAQAPAGNVAVAGSAFDSKRTMLGVPQTPGQVGAPQAQAPQPQAFQPPPFQPPPFQPQPYQPQPFQPQAFQPQQPGQQAQQPPGQPAQAQPLGQQLAGQGQQQQVPMDPKRTMLGMPQSAIAAPAAPVAEKPDYKRTMLGMPGNAGGLPQQPPPSNRTMIGVADPNPAASPAPPAPPAPPVLTQDAAKKTMLGVAVPGIAPTQASAPTPQVQAGASRTMLGVAVPGIAPVNPGAYVAPPPAPMAGPAYDPSLDEPEAPRRVPRKIVIAEVPFFRRPAVVLSGLAALVVVFGVVVAVLWKSPPPIKSEARIDQKGQDYLQIACASCPEGTTLSIEANKAVVMKGTVDLPLTKPLAVGENRFVVHIDRPSTGRDEDVKLVVPIAYRIRPDLSQLAAAQPQVQISIEATEGTKVTVEGKPVALDAGGKGMHSIDVSSECAGSEGEQRTIDKKIAYEITPKGGTTDKGTVAVKVGVPPLVLEAPRPQSVIDSPNFLVGGRTMKGATIEIEGTQIPVGPDGTFSRTLRVDKMGPFELRVRALGRDQAPRTVTLKLKRITDFAAEAREFSAQAKLDVGALMADAKAHAGEAVVLGGEVVESRAQGSLTVVLLEATEGCKKAPCLIRVLRAGTDLLPKGEKTRVYGHVVGLYEAKGAPSVPEVDADFLIKSGKP